MYQTEVRILPWNWVAPSPPLKPYVYRIGKNPTSVKSRMTSGAADMHSDARLLGRCSILPQFTPCSTWAHPRLSRQSGVVLPQLYSPTFDSSPGTVVLISAHLQAGHWLFHGRAPISGQKLRRCGTARAEHLTPANRWTV